MTIERRANEKAATKAGAGDELPRSECSTCSNPTSESQSATSTAPKVTALYDSAAAEAYL